MASSKRSIGSALGASLLAALLWTPHVAADTPVADCWSCGPADCACAADGETEHEASAEAAAWSIGDASGATVWVSDELFYLMQEAQPAPLTPVPETFQPEAALPVPAVQLSTNVFGPRSANRSLLSEARQSRARALTADVVLGSESLFRASTDAANLLGKSNSTLGVTVDRRAPIITDPRIRGSQIGQLSASGSYWFPARPDLDTLLSKIDSRIVSDLIVIKGPYAARYGPGFSFIDLQLLTSPRYYDGYESHRSSSIEFKTNGEQWYGRQTFWGGSDNYGYRIGYGHRTGNDYDAGNDQSFIGSYNSRDVDVALGYDLSPCRHLEFNYLRLDQTGVELANQFLDIDFLKTDAFELSYIWEDHAYFDLVTAETWYNATKIQGDANSVGKRAQVPFLVVTDTTVESESINSSAGFTVAATRGNPDVAETTLGLDFRYLRQKINQFYPDTTLFFPLEFNQPQPKGHSYNPGLFVEHVRTVRDGLVVSGGARFDLVDTNAINFAPRVDAQGGFPPLNTPFDPANPGPNFPLPPFPDFTTDLEQALGGGQFNRHFTLGSVYLTASRELNCHWTATAGGAYAMRPPTMSELYSVGPIVSVFPQLTVTSLVGNPRLDSEQRYQVDVGLHAEYCQLRFGADGYYAWVTDYITFDRIVPEGVTFAYTQTDLATVAGFDLYAEYVLSDSLAAFGTMSYVEGRDLTRDVNAIPAARFRSVSSPRSGVSGSEEPLPMIAPLDSRVGLIWRDSATEPGWGTELTVRMVANQDRIASSLGELPTGAFTTVDLRSFWRPNNCLTLIAGVENLFDAAYQEHFDSHGQDIAFPLPADVGGGVLTLGNTRDVLRPGVNFYFSSELLY